MYVPSAFAEPDRALLLDFIEEYGFASLISLGDGAPTVSHVPLLLDRTVPGAEHLLGHVARANRHWAQFDGRTPTLAIFNGPHAYVSPSWYSRAPSVPTWNYAVVHVHGTAQALDAAHTEAILRRLIEKYEGPRASRWSGELPDDFVRAQLRAIVGFRLELGKLVGKFKLSQNKDEADREGVLAGLEHEPDAASRALAAFSRKYVQRGAGG